jgi:hypothetical protein
MEIAPPSTVPTPHVGTLPRSNVAAEPRSNCPRASRKEKPRIHHPGFMNKGLEIGKAIF